ncbi:hypothetical protein [Georgenia alba]|uniref:Uncharacterized protein n=1 Tax=Georgenia alba TaxID=2233858 RepID=A0ABW2Q7X3_9MICO
MTAESPRRPRRGRTTAVVAVAVLLVTVVGGLAWWQPWNRAATGEVLRGDPSDVDGRGTTLTLPTGEIEIRVGQPRNRLPDDGALPPLGGSFVPVSISASARAVLSVPGAGEVPAARVGVSAGGSRFTLSGSDDGAYYLVTGDRSSDVTITVRFDGESQTLTVGADGTEVDARRFADVGNALEGTLEERTFECGDARVAESVRGGAPDVVEPPPFDCTVLAARLSPWVHGLGWAPAGQAWLVGDVDPTVRGSFYFREVTSAGPLAPVTWEAAVQIARDRLDANDTPPPIVHLGRTEAQTVFPADDTLGDPLTSAGNPWRFVAAVDADEPLPDAEITYGFPVEEPRGPFPVDDFDEHEHASWTVPLEVLR